MARLATLLGLTGLGAVLAGCGSSGASETLTVQGREVILDSPSRLGNNPAPLIVALHGGLGSAQNFQSQLQLRNSGRLDNVRVAYLQGTKATRLTPRRRAWNAGGCCGLPQRSGVNDVGYIAAVIQTLSQQGLVSPGRVTLVGHSNGAMMANYFVCQRGGLVNNVIAISGPLTTGNCSGASGVRILQLHGTADTNVPVQGGRGSGPSGVEYPSLEASASRLRRAGASVQIELLQGAGHSMSDINGALRGRGGIAGLISQYAN